VRGSRERCSFFDSFFYPHNDILIPVANVKVHDGSPGNNIVCTGFNFDASTRDDSAWLTHVFWHTVNSIQQRGEAPDRITAHVHGSGAGMVWATGENDLATQNTDDVGDNAHLNSQLLQNTALFDVHFNESLDLLGIHPGLSYPLWWEPRSGHSL
jgi:ATP-dependent Clp protease adapter protein ClpS